MSKTHNVISLLQKNAMTNPDRCALKWGSDLSITYKELMDQISSVACGLKKLGIKKNDRVLIFTPLSLDLYLSMFAVQQVGAIAVFLDSWARREELGMCASVVEPKAVISFEKAFELIENIPGFLEKIPHKIVVGAYEKNYSASLNTFITAKGSCPIEAVSLDDTALITFTTGSSGTPKGANRTHRFLASQHTALEQVLPYDGDEIDLPTFPIFALNNLASGITTILPSIDLANPSPNDGKALSAQIIEHNIDCTTLSPSLFVKVSNYCYENNLSLPSVKRVVTGGAPISKENVKLFRKIAPDAKIMVLYGSTEVEPIAHIEAQEMLLHCEQGEGVNVGPISKDLDYKFLHITKDPIELADGNWDRWEMPKGKIGELVVSGAHVCEGYYNNEEAFKRAKIVDEKEKIWHRTGDLGFVDKKGSLWFVGRVHNTIKRANTLLFPVQAELLLKRLAFVDQAAFLGLDDNELGQKACAVVSLKKTASIETAEDFIHEIKSILTKNNIPSDEIKIVEKIPMDPRHQSKVEYEQLKKLLQ